MKREIRCLVTAISVQNVYARASDFRLQVSTWLGVCPQLRALLRHKIKKWTYRLAEKSSVNASKTASTRTSGVGAPPAVQFQRVSG